MECRKLTLQDALQCEVEIRDYLQVEVGRLALLESRKSIEMSDTQIKEGRRGEYTGRG